jgi:hypothetical protein
LTSPRRLIPVSATDNTSKDRKECNQFVDECNSSRMWGFTNTNVGLYKPSNGETDLDRLI